MTQPNQSKKLKPIKKLRSLCFRSSILMETKKMRTSVKIKMVFPKLEIEIIRPFKIFKPSK